MIMSEIANSNILFLQTVSHNCLIVAMVVPMFRVVAGLLLFYNDIALSCQSFFGPTSTCRTVKSLYGLEFGSINKKSPCSELFFDKNRICYLKIHENGRKCLTGHLRNVIQEV